MKRAFVYLALLGLTACGVSQGDHNAVIEARDAALAESVALRVEVDTLRNGEKRLIAMAVDHYDEDERKSFRETVASLRNWHPQSTALEGFDAKLIELSERDEVDRLARIAEKAERDRIANLNNTGIWQVSNYVDDFGENTGEKLVRNRDLILGTFSNTATQNSELNVRLLIDGPREIDIVLYEYAGNNPVKAYSPDEYTVQMMDSAGERHRLKAVNHGDRLSFGPQHSGKVFAALEAGGTVKFAIYETDSPTNEYDFTIRQADYFENAVRLMKEK